MPFDVQRADDSIANAKLPNPDNGGSRNFENGVSGSGKPGLKLGAEVRNCMWRLCWTGVIVMAMTTRLTLVH